MNQTLDENNPPMPPTNSAPADPALSPPLPSDPLDVPDEIFARLRPRRPPRRPLVALGVIILGLILLWHLRADFTYALSSRTPLDLGNARSFSGDNKNLLSNRLVTVSGLPDYRNALFFEPRGDSYRRAFFRLLGSQNRVLVGADQTSTRHLGLSEHFAGRLWRFDDVGYAEQVRNYYANRVQATRLLDLDELRQLLASGVTLADVLARQGVLHDGAGETLSLTPTHKLIVVVDFSDELKLALSRNHYAVAEDATHEIARLGATLVGEVEITRENFVVTARISPEKRNNFLGLIEEKGITFAAHQERLTVSPGELRGPRAGAPNTNIVVTDRTFSWPQIASVQAQVPIAIPHDAWLIVENEMPANFLWVPILSGVLILFLLFNLWLLVRALRPERAAASRETSP